MAKKWRENLNLNGNRGADDISFGTKSRDLKKNVVSVIEQIIIFQIDRFCRRS